MFDYELLTSIDRHSVSVRARDVIDNGWRCGKYPLTNLSCVSWGLSDNSNRSWNFHIHSWDMFDELLAAYSQEAAPELLVPCIRIALDWSSRYGTRETALKDTLFAWYDMAVGLRAYRLAYLIEAARQVKLLSAQEDQTLWSSLLAHQSYLADDANIAFHNNHGYYQVAGQLAMGRRFSTQSPLMQEAYSQGEARLRVMLAQQFAADGVHREHSPDYHRMVYDTLSGLMASGLVNDPALYELAIKVEEALAWFVMPNQRLANFGDSDYRNISRKQNEAVRKWRTPAMRWQASGGVVGEDHTVGLKRFEQGGYFVYRQPGATFSDAATYLAQTAAFHSRTHKHADDLSFIWYDQGSEVLVDAGRYGYLGKTEQGSALWLDGHWYADPKRIYCESTRAHNCLEFDGKNYPRKGIKPYGVALGRSLEHPSGLVILETECRHFSGNRHARVLLLKPGEWLVVVDWFHDNLGKKHDVKQWFHLADTWHLEQRENMYEAVSSVTGQRLQIAALLPGSKASRPYYGEAEPMLQGWWSPSERQLLANFAFCFTQSKVKTGTFATILNFSETVKPDLRRSRTTASGRQIKLLWSDQRGEHCLDISRPAEGEFYVNYNGE